MYEFLYDFCIIVYILILTLLRQSPVDATPLLFLVFT
jgi:hypothetical protein